jgi:DNA mismatch repair protein MutS
LRIRDGRHPVLDQTLPPGTFVPNDAAMGPEDGTFLLITGPNMGGKSVYIRQVALITLLAQAGSFVPAKEATIGLADRIFTRVGASDELGRGQSTFMVEMTEAANILNNATPRSLVILDEIGRGTSTYDGVSLAWGITEYLHDTVGCRTLFATHYHELAELAERLAGLRNYNVLVHEAEDGIVMLHKIAAGSADKSYGLHVAQRAGVPATVLERAKQVLAELEEHHLRAPERPAARIRRPKVAQISLFANTEDPVLAALRELDVDALPPGEVAEAVRRWQRELGR